MDKLVLVLFIIIFINYLRDFNRDFKVTHYTIRNEKIPFDLKIVQISDVHLRDGKTIYPRINEQSPDLVFITGDLFDSYSDSYDNVETLISNINYPMYYVTGNHENRHKDDFKKMKELLEKYHVKVLEDEVVKYKNINIVGIHDKWFKTDGLNKIELDDDYTILLAHRAEDFKQYVSKNIDLVLAGHIHGGILQLPFLGAIFSPNDELLFPDYYCGIYKENNTTMVVSSGLGDSRFRFRINAKCELVVVKLSK